MINNFFPIFDTFCQVILHYSYSINVETRRIFGPWIFGGISKLRWKSYLTLKWLIYSNNYWITKNQCHICPLMQNRFQRLTLVSFSMHSGQMCQGKPSITVIHSNSLNLNQFFESEPISLQFLPKSHESLLSGHHII